MARCERCGNDYDKAFEVRTADGAVHVFDSFECAVNAMAPRCDQCENMILGHGMEAEGRFFCCAHCAHAAGESEMRDRAAAKSQGESLQPI